MANRGSFVKGVKKPNQGKRGPNKATVEFRQTVQALLDANRDNLGEWLKRVSEDDAGKALALITNLAEFAAPKLARTEVAGDPDKPLQHNMRVTFE